MLKGKLIHPDIMAALALCGHGDKVLIADGNYPLDSKTGQAETVYLGLTPGLPTVTDVLAAIQSTVNIEKAEVMDPADGTTPEIFGEFQTMLDGMELNKLGRYEFYDACCQPGVRLAISTGEQRIFFQPADHHSAWPDPACLTRFLGSLSSAWNAEKGSFVPVAFFSFLCYNDL